jgi:hypothetical protein
MRQFFARFKYFTATLLFLFTSAMSSGGAVFADSASKTDQPVHKSYICKYVGKPGVNERLQTGNNPIWTDNNSLVGKDEAVTVGQEFSDAQGKSVVIVANTPKLDPEPGLDQCPPPAPDQIPVPATPGFTDPCGVSNATWTQPADSATVTWSVVNGHLIATTTAGNVFVGGSTTHDYGLAIDSNELCPPNEIPVPEMPGMTDPCGSENASWVKPANSATVTWSVVNGHLIATTTAGNVFVGGSTTHDYGLAIDSNEACPCGCQYTVTPGDVTFADACGTSNDTYTIPTTAHVKYYVNGSIVPTTAGTYPATGTVSVVAVADQGYVLSGTASWSHEFTNKPCVVKVYPPRVEFKDLCEVKDDSFTIPVKAGVVYKINGQVAAAGTYDAYNNPYDNDGTVTVTAEALPGYHLKDGKHWWTHHFTDEECGGGGGEQTPATPGAATFNDVCATANDTYTIPTTVGVTYKVNGVVMAAGTYVATGSVTVTAEAQPGYVLNGASNWAHTFTNESCGQVLGDSIVLAPTAGKGAELANTGQSSLTSAVIAFVIATSALLVYAFAPKRQLS